MAGSVILTAANGCFIKKTFDCINVEKGRC